jgi:hypothetical protein
MRPYRSDRFVPPAPISFTALRRTEDALLSALPDDFEILVFAPVLPLVGHSAVVTVGPRKVIATVRGSEVVADPTNALALEESLRRSLALAVDPRSATGGGYYMGVCFKIYAGVEDQDVDVADGGFVDWSQLVTGNRKERLLISDFDVDRLTEMMPSLPILDQSPPYWTGDPSHRY